MFRISVTTVEKYRRFITNASPYDTETALIETIRGLFAGNDKTRVGSAYHKIIEDPSQAQSYAGGKGIVFDNIFFTAEQAHPAIRYRSEHATMIHEVPAQKIYELENGFRVQMSGRFDGVEGIQIRDAKCKFRSPNFQEYLDSSQWKYYLDMMGTDVFFYDVFEVKGFDSLSGQQPFQLTDVEFIPHEPLKCTRYINLEKDCADLLTDFMEYIRFKNFFPLLKTVKENETVVF